MAVCVPKNFFIIEDISPNPFVIGNLEFLMKDLIPKARTNAFRKSCCCKTQKLEQDTKENNCRKEKEYLDANVRPESFIDFLAKIAIEVITDAAKTDKKQDEIPEESNEERNVAVETNKKDELATPKYSRGQIPTTFDANKSRTIQERIIPIQTVNSEDYIVKFNFKGCPTSSIKVNYEEGLISVTGRKEEDESTKIISYERKIPADVDSSSLTASYTNDGILKVTGKRTQTINDQK